MTTILLIILLTLVGFALIILDLLFVPGGAIIALGVAGIIYAVFLNYTHYGALPAFLHFAACLAVTPKLTTWSLSRVALKNEMHANAGYVGLSSRAQFIGMHGIATSDLRPAGKIRIDLAVPTFLDCVADGGYIAKGDAVQVVEERGPSLVVRKVT